MLARATVSNTGCVLIPGDSGGAGGALVQLAKLRSGRVIALASEVKHTTVEKLGADVVFAPPSGRSQTEASIRTCDCGFRYRRRRDLARIN